MRSIETHGLPITRAVFTQGRSPYKYMPAFGMKLFLSAEPRDVAEATELGFPAGQVVGSVTDLKADDPSDRDLRIAFDFDAVLADDSAERVYVDEGIEGYHEHEATMAEVRCRLGQGKTCSKPSTVFRISRTPGRRMTLRMRAACSSPSSPPVMLLHTRAPSSH